MKKVFMFLGVLGIIATLPAFINKDEQHPNYQQFEMRKITNNAFTYGEKLTYRVHYGFINAGNIDMQVKDNPVNINGRYAYHIDGFGTSRSGFDWMFKVRDHFESYLDTQGILPLQFVKSQKEGGYEDTDFVIFDHKLKKYFSKKGTKTTPIDIQDVLSVAYYARTLDVKNAPVGTEFTLNVYLDNEIYPLTFKVDGREVITTDVGKINAIRIIPQVVDGRVFKDKNALKVWVSDDENKVPLRIQAEILVGSIKADITSYSGLKKTLNFKN
jgi:hypothetical protein